MNNKITYLEKITEDSENDDKDGRGSKIGRKKDRKSEKNVASLNDGINSHLFSRFNEVEDNIEQI